MLSAWFRIKYPNVVDGALAASAPLLGTVGAVPRTYFFQDVTKVKYLLYRICINCHTKFFRLSLNDRLSTQPLFFTVRGGTASKTVLKNLVKLPPRRSKKSEITYLSSCRV